MFLTLVATCGFCLAPAVIISFSGCGTIPPPTVVQGIQAVTSGAATFAMQKDPNAKPYLQLVDQLLTDALVTGQTNLAELHQALLNVSINGIKKSATMQNAIVTGVNFYESLVADSATKSLDKLTIAQYLVGFDNGIRQALNESPISIPPPPTGTNAFYPGIRILGGKVLCGPAI